VTLLEDGTLRDQLILLYELQQLDARIRDCEHRLQLIPQEAVATKEHLDQSQGSLTELLTRQDTNERDRRAIERDLAADKEKLRKWEARLNDIRNSKQIAALSTEVDRHASTYHELHQVSEEKSDLVRSEMEQIRGARGSITGRLQPAVLKKYEYIRARRDGIGLVVLAEGTCQGCHMQLPAQMYNELQRGDRIEVCPSCQRILFFERLAQRTTEDQAGVQP
jgi:predicted  nucleic acid-binding Zn-ribbon protein